MPGFLHRLSGKFQISRKIRTQNFKIQTQTIQTNTQIHILEDFGSINNSVMCRTLPTSVNSLWSASTKGLVQKLVVVLLSFNPPPAIRFLTCPCLLHWRPPWLLAVECLWFQYWGKPEHSERGTSKTCTRARTHTHTHAHAHTHTHTHIHTHTRTHARTHTLRVYKWWCMGLLPGTAKYCEQHGHASTDTDYVRSKLFWKNDDELSLLLLRCWPQTIIRLLYYFYIVLKL